MKYSTSISNGIVFVKHFYFWQGIETSLVGATHAQAVTSLRNTGEHVTLVVLPAASFPPVTKTAPLYSSKHTPILIPYKIFNNLLLLSVCLRKRITFLDV